MDPWDDFRVFLAVARQESLSAAGRALRIDPATVGRRVARLEQRLGQPLFAKSPQGYALTDAGQRLLPHAELAEQATQGAVEALAGGTEGLTGQIRIGAPDGCANFLLPQVCAALSRDNPELEIQILSQPRVVNLSKREADLAISVSPPTAGRLSVQKIADYHLHIAAAQDYLARHPAIAAPAALTRPSRGRLYLRHDLRPRARLPVGTGARPGASGVELGLGAAQLAAPGRRHRHRA